MNNLLNKIQNIFREVLEIDDLVISKNTSAEDIEEWDSLNHIYLIVEIETEFNVKFTSSQIQSWKNVGDMIDELRKFS